MRSASSSRHRRPIPPPKEGMLRGARSRGSTLQLVTSNHDLLTPHMNSASPRPARRKHQHAIINQLASWKHWLLDSAKRARSPGKRATRSTPNLVKPAAIVRTDPKDPSPRPQTSETPASTRPTLQPGPQSLPSVGRVYTTPTSNKRLSISPSPLTPRSTFRRASSGLRGRTSTSSSVSSIRSIHHHHHTHSKASSTSSNGSGSLSKVSVPARSPHHSVKVLPATPTTSAFPSNIRLVRQAPISSFNEGVWGNSLNSSSHGGLVFAKRKKHVFKGPMLNANTSSPTSSAGGSGVRAGSHSRSTSLAGRRSGEIIEEEDEDEVEEVEAFSPITGEDTEETIYPPGETSR